MKDNRPVNLDIGSMKLPITAYASITHRISGIIMVVSAFLLLWALEQSLAGPESFASLRELLASPVARFIAWGISTALAYHALAGVKHLVMDFGVGESLEGGVLGARLVIASALILSILLGVAIW